MTQPLLKEELDWLYEAQHFGIKLGLENAQRLMRTFCPDRPPHTKVIQVAGTNGKGSTCALIEAVARAEGLRTGLFTSPHFVHFAERIRVNGELILDSHLALLIKELREQVAGWDPHPTFFELSLALAVRYFVEQSCDLIILEVGMGGRLDATTAVPIDLAVITPIGKDHQRYLGETLELIAREKGEIMRPLVPCVSAPQEEAAARVLSTVATEKGVELSTVTSPLRGFDLALRGEHQQWNAALAVEALSTLCGGVSNEAVIEGLKSVQWPGRFEEIHFQDGLVVLDCCHNEHAARLLVKEWQNRFGTQKAHLIFGGSSDKNTKGILEVLLPVVETVELYEMENARAEKAEVLLAAFKELSSNCPVRILETFAQRARHSHTLVTGSLFLVGEWIEHHGGAQSQREAH